jgi:hypothetical protein
MPLLYRGHLAVAGIQQVDLLERIRGSQRPRVSGRTR